MEAGLSRPRLTVAKLLESGFTELGCWATDSEGGLTHDLTLPQTSGVYAFAIDGAVQYVGLASRSLRQRLNFYRKPGATQRTNIRLNGIIVGELARGAAVQVLVASPPDQSWNGLCVSGPAGLEAGLIATYELPWNMRGSTLNARPEATTARTRAGGRVSGVRERIIEIVGRRSHMTELEIATAIYGPAARQQQVNAHCRALLKEGRLARQGSGGPGDPFTYRLKR